MENETEETEVKEQESSEESEDNQGINLLEEAKKANEEKAKLLDREEKLLLRKEKLQAEAMLTGTSLAGQEQKRTDPEMENKKKAADMFAGTGIDDAILSHDE